MAVKKNGGVVPMTDAPAPSAPVASATATAAAGTLAVAPAPAAMPSAPATPAPQPLVATIPAATAGATNPQVTVTMEKAMKTAEEFVSFGQANVEAFVKAGQIWAAGMQDMGKQFAATAQAQMDETVATMKAMAGVKSLKEAMDLQSSLARASMEKAMAETGKLTDASLKLTEQAMAPIAARVTVAMEKFGRTA